MLPPFYVGFLDVQKNVPYNKNVQKNVHKEGLPMIVNITAARKNLFQLAESAIKYGEPIIVTGKTGNVVIVSEDDWRAMQETIYLSSITGTKEKIIEGIKTSLDECVEDDSWRGE
jgi:prevent-host-death family protein